MNDPTMSVKCPECGRVNFCWRTRCMKCNHLFTEATHKTLEDSIQGWRNAANQDQYEPFACVIRGPWIDGDGYERALRVNGCIECPQCGLIWPMIEDVEEWREKDGRMAATGWGPGTAECCVCEKVFVDTFDGCFELEL